MARDWKEYNAGRDKGVEAAEDGLNVSRAKVFTEDKSDDYIDGFWDAFSEYDRLYEPVEEEGEE